MPYSFDYLLIFTILKTQYLFLIIIIMKTHFYGRLWLLPLPLLVTSCTFSEPLFVSDNRSCLAFTLLCAVIILYLARHRLRKLAKKIGSL